MADNEAFPLLATDAKRGMKASFQAFVARFWSLGLVSFGGPQAHVALMHDVFVDTPRFDEQTGKIQPHLAESTFLELYALCQSLPGPGSTQLATSLGATFGGLPGAIITFLVFALPGMTIMTLAGVWYHGHLNSVESIKFIARLNEYLLGLISAAFAMVCLAAIKIIGKCCGNDRVKYAVCIFTSTVAVLVTPQYASGVYILLLINGGIIALIQKMFNDNDSLSSDDDDGYKNWECGIPQTVGWGFIGAYFCLTGIAIFVNPVGKISLFHIWKVFWTVGAIGFGGGIVVIPMLLNSIVETGMLPDHVFLAGFALFGCVPGPMFGIAPFLGAAMASYPGALQAVIGLYLPGITILLGVLPFWEQIRKKRWVRDCIRGVNSAAAGLIIAGVWMLLKRTMIGPASFALTVSATAAMYVYKIPSPIAIVLHGVIGAIFVYLGIGPPYRVS